MHDSIALAGEGVQSEPDITFMNSRKEWKRNDFFLALDDDCSVKVWTVKTVDKKFLQKIN